MNETIKLFHRDIQIGQITENIFTLKKLKYQRIFTRVFLNTSPHLLFD